MSVVLEEGDGWQRVVTLTLRPATDADGPALGRLFAESGLPHPEIDWTRPGIGAWWWVAEGPEGLVGAIQAVPTKPWGLIGDVLVHPDARQGDRPGQPSIARHLFVTALATLRHYGCQEVRGFVEDDHAQWRHVLTRYATEHGLCRMYGTRLEG